MELKGFQCYFLAWKINPPWSFKLLSVLWILTQWPLLCVFQTLGFPYITFSFLDLFLRRRPECSVAFPEQQELAISSLAWIHTFLPAGLVILFNKHTGTSLFCSKLPMASQLPQKKPEEYPVVYEVHQALSGHHPLSLWAVPSCLFYAAPAPISPTLRSVIRWRT